MVIMHVSITMELIALHDGPLIQHVGLLIRINDAVNIVKWIRHVKKEIVLEYAQTDIPLYPLMIFSDAKII